jgi:biopolymer transport protein ExbD
MIRFSCPYCGKKLGATETSVGKEKTCPNCRGRVRVPTAEAAAERAAKTAARDAGASHGGDHALLLVGRRPEHKDLIDMTAMVDIVFFLLIFFLVTSMQSIEAVINLPVPQAASSAPNTVQAVPDISNDPNFVVVTIDADDAVFVEDEEALSEQDLRAKLRKAHQEQGKDGMMVSGSGDSTHGKFVMVLDAGADAGMTEIMFSVPQADERASGG